MAEKITLSLTVTVDGNPVDAFEWINTPPRHSWPYVDFCFRTMGTKWMTSGKVDSNGTWSDTFTANGDLDKLAADMLANFNSNKSKFKKNGAKTVTIEVDGNNCRVTFETFTKIPSACKVVLKNAEGTTQAKSLARKPAQASQASSSASSASGSSSGVGMWQEGMIIIRAIDGVSENVTQDFLRLNSGGSDLMKYLRSGEGRGQWKFARNGDAQLEVLRKVKHVMDPEEYKKYLWRNYIGVSLSNKLKEGRLAVENWSIKIVEAEPDYYHYIFRFEIPGYKSKQGFQGLRV